MFVNKCIFSSQIKYLFRFRNDCNKNRIKQQPYATIISEDLPSEISYTQIKKTLKVNKLTYEEGFVNIIADCPICEFSDKEDKNKVYINKTTGLLICPSCRYTNQWNILDKFFSQTKSNKHKKEVENIRSEIKTIKEKESLLWERLLAETQLVDENFINSDKNLAKKFHLDKIPNEILVQAEARIDESHENLYFPLLNAKSMIVGFKILNHITGKETTLPSIGCSGVLSLQKTSRASISKLKDTTAIIVLSVKDILALHTQKLNGIPICLPYNLTSLPQQCLPALENYSKLILWFAGDDANSWDASRNFAKKLNEKRCLFVRPTDNQPPAYEAYCLGLDFKQILGNAQTIWHRAITSFSALRQDVLSELQNIEKVAGVKWKRYPVLNRILKGHRRGELTVLTGPTGSGKTTFMSEYSLDLAMQGVSTLWGSFEIRNARLARAMLQQFSEIPLDHNLHMFDHWADKFEELPIYFMLFHGQQSVKVVMEAVEHATYVHDISHVIIDNVQFMMGISDEPRSSDRFWKQDAIIASFRTFATRKNCHVTLVIHPRKERENEDLTTSSIFGGAKASQEADNVLIIQDKRLTSVRGKKFLQIAKNRYSGDLGVMPLEFDKSSLSYAYKKKKIDEKHEKSSKAVEIDQNSSKAVETD